MPNDQQQSSILASSNLSKYPALEKFLQVSQLQSQTGDSAGALSSNQALDLLEEAINETQSQAEVDLGSQTGGQKQKEVLSPVTEAAPAVEAAPKTNVEASVPVEAAAEAGAELGQELAEISKEVQEQRQAQDIKDQQTAINNLAQQAQQPLSDVKPVVVLPITVTQEAQGKHKSPNFSLRWLVEWANKIKKIFSGAVLYQEEVENSADV